jgi:O-antigen/teichoic acid export membrane protein
MLAKVSTLAWTVLVARELTAAEFGTFSYAFALMLLVSALPAWGFNSVLVRRVSVRPELASRVYTETMAWQTSLGVPVLLGAGLIAVFARPSTEAAAALALVLAAGLPELGSHAARASASAQQQQGGVALALVAQRFLTAGLISTVVLSGGGVVGVSAAFLTGTCLGWLAHIVAIHRLDVRADLSQLTWAGMRDLAAEAKLVGLSAVILVALFRLDIILLEALVGVDAVASYAVAYRLLESVLFVAFAVRQAVAPVMSTSVDRVRVGYERGMAVVSFFYLPFAAVLLSEPRSVIALLFGSSYVAESAPILRYLALAPLLFSCAFLGLAGLVSTRDTGAMLVGSLVATAANVALNLLLIPSLAGSGAAIATTVSYLVLSASVLLALRRSGVVVNVVRPLLESAVAAVALAGFLVASPLPLLAELLVGSLLYLAVWYVVARRLAPEQVSVVRSFLPGGSR